VTPLRKLSLVVLVMPTPMVVASQPMIQRASLVVSTTIEGKAALTFSLNGDLSAHWQSGCCGSGTGGGILHNGAVAGFPLPPLLYVVGSADARTPAPPARSMRLLGPEDNDVVMRDRVQALGGDGAMQQRSVWRTLKFAPTLDGSRADSVSPSRPPRP